MSPTEAGRSERAARLFLCLAAEQPGAVARVDRPPVPAKRRAGLVGIKHRQLGDGNVRREDDAAALACSDHARWPDVAPQRDQWHQAVARHVYTRARVELPLHGRPLDEVLEVGLDLVARRDVFLQQIETVDLL